MFGPRFWYVFGITSDQTTTPMGFGNVRMNPHLTNGKTHSSHSFPLVEVSIILKRGSSICN
jgi:hypothetical protein